jgi:hypothetical protein
MQDDDGACTASRTKSPELSPELISQGETKPALVCQFTRNFEMSESTKVYSFGDGITCTIDRFETNGKKGKAVIAHRWATIEKTGQGNAAWFWISQSEGHRDFLQALRKIKADPVRQSQKQGRDIIDVRTRSDW